MESERFGSADVKRKRGRPLTNHDEIRWRAHDVWVNLRALPEVRREEFLTATVEEITSTYFFPPDSYLARKFPAGHFPAELVLEAKQHRDYPKRDRASQLWFIARFIAGVGVVKPSYSLKLTRKISRT